LTLNLEVNDDDLTFSSRDDVCARIASSLDSFRLHEKYQPVIVHSSRGMEKTFLMKSMIKSEFSSVISSARNIGRIWSVECNLVYDALCRVFVSMSIEERSQRILSYFWQVVYVYNMVVLLRKKSVQLTKSVRISFDDILLSALC
jgi:hypothetical protein